MSDPPLLGPARGRRVDVLALAYPVRVHLDRAPQLLELEAAVRNKRDPGEIDEPARPFDIVPTIPFELLAIVREVLAWREADRGGEAGIRARFREALARYDRGEGQGSPE